MQIVLARVETEHLLAEEGRRDLGESNRMKQIVVGKSVLYAYRPRKGDLEKAQEFAKREGYIVLTYQGSKSPTRQAREDILKMYERGEVGLYEEK